MIGKVASSGGKGFRGVVNYLMRGKRNEPNPNRVAWTATRNLMIEDPDFAPIEMRATASQSVKSKKPVYHMVVSWHEHEEPNDEMMRAVAETTLADLDLLDHQALMIAHKDTHHRHLHIVVNKVHPETGRTWSNSNDFERIELSIARQAKERGLKMVPGRFNSPELFGEKPRRPRDGEFQKAYRNGKPDPAPYWSIDQIQARKLLLSSAFDKARSWDQLQGMLSGEGVTIVRKGQGLVLMGEDGFMKLSDLGKNVRMRGLEERFGETFASFDARREPVEMMPGVASEPAPRQAPTPKRKPEDPFARSRERPNDLPKDKTRKRTTDEDDNTVGDDLLEAEVDRLREEERQKRIARREAALAARAEDRKNTSEDDGSGTTRTPNVAANVDGGSGGSGSSPRGEAFADLGSARAGVDIAKRLYRAGLATKEQLERAEAELKRREDDLQQHLTFAERLEGEIYDALARQGPAPKPKAPPPPQKSEKPKPKQKPKSGRKKHDREDDRDR